MRRLDPSKIPGLLMMGAVGLLGLYVLKGAVTMMLAPPPPQAGEVAPEFSLPVLGQREPQALSAYRGDVVLLEFWTSSCVGCIGATPKLNRLHERYRTAGFAVVSVNMDGDEGEAAREVVKDRAIVYPVLLDPGHVATRYGVYATPTAILLDAFGRVRAVHRGNVTEQRLDKEIRLLLDQRKATREEPSA